MVERVSDVALDAVPVLGGLQANPATSSDITPNTSATSLLVSHPTTVVEASQGRPTLSPPGTMSSTLGESTAPTTHLSTLAVVVPRPPTPQVEGTVAFVAPAPNPPVSLVPVEAVSLPSTLLSDLPLTSPGGTLQVLAPSTNGEKRAAVVQDNGGRRAGLRSSTQTPKRPVVDEVHGAAEEPPRKKVDSKGGSRGRATKKKAGRKGKN